jgi:hypothetical protein
MFISSSFAFVGIPYLWDAFYRRTMSRGIRRRAARRAESRGSGLVENAPTYFGGKGKDGKSSPPLEPGVSTRMCAARKLRRPPIPRF